MLNQIDKENAANFDLLGPNEFLFGLDNDAKIRENTTATER